MKWAKTTEELSAMNLDHIGQAAIDLCFEEYTSINDDGTQTGQDGKKKKKGEVKNSAALDTFGEWVTYPSLTQDSATYPKKFFPGLNLTKPLALDKEGRRRYEVFCGGFLYYHDVIFKKYQIKDLYLKYYGENHDKKVFEHKIYFEWFGKGDIKLNEDSTEIAEKVTIYITPTPPDLNPDPPDPPGGPPPY
ncbi:hypothetical protein [Terrimonas pollutisoli]|uniref:hypothetical protein n=1 Tax=Terrimonas pollutisoli TaxID=3034147 RepID=UPI0023EAEE25|nr:hypothetical protein [Terrimonas sp. H1YJ31]